VKTLYEYTNEFCKIIDLINDCDEITPEQLDALGDTLKESKEQTKQKMINVAAYIKELEYHSENIEKAVNEMQQRQKSTLKKVESLRNYLKYNMELVDIKEVKTPEFDIKVRYNRYALEISNPDIVPEDYMRKKLTVSIDRQQIIKDLKNDVLVPGASFSTTSSLQIK